MKKIYGVTLDEDIVKEAQRNFTKYGGKLSPLINELLKDWVTKQKTIQTK